MSEHHPGIGPELHEQERRDPAITAYVLRHGETTENKMDPRRGLTEKGKEQARAQAERIIQELHPERDEIRLYDSGVDRANETLWYIADVLQEKGFTVVMSKTSMTPEGAQHQQDKLTEGGPGVQRRVKNLAISKEYRPKLYDPEYKESLGLSQEAGPVMVWLKDSQRDEKTETPDQAFARVDQAVRSTERIAGRFAKHNPNKRVVAISVTHGGVLEGYLTKKLDMTSDELGEMENLEGFKVDFIPGAEPSVSVFGEHAEGTLRQIGKG